MVDTRALLPNGNDPATVPPATVGPPSARPGNPNGIELEVTGPATPRTAWPPPVAPWSGLPGEWPTPPWSSWQARLEQLSDIAWACIDLNAGLLSTMPPYLVDPAATLDAGWLENPDPDLYSDWTEFAKQMFWDYQCGEAFVVCTARYGTGWPARFHVVNPLLVNVELDADGLREYSIGDTPVPRYDMMHLRYTSRTDDAHGHGPLEVGQSRIIAANVLTRYATNLASAGGIPSSILSHPAELTAGRARELLDQWLEARMSNLGLPALLSGGVTWQATQMNPRDMALFDLSQMNEARIAVLLRRAAVSRRSAVGWGSDDVQQRQRHLRLPLAQRSATACRAGDARHVGMGAATRDACRAQP